MTGTVVVNADDLGVSRGATLGIVRAHREGIVTSASLTPTTSHYRHALEMCVRECPELGIGLHFTLSAGKPVSPVRDVPLLVDEQGWFRWRFFSLLRAAGVQRSRDLLEQVDAELEAQLQRLLADGVRPDHIDGERHVHLIPGLFERVVAAARRHRIPFVRVGLEAGMRFATPAEWPGLFLRGGFAKSWLLSGLSRRNRKFLGEGVASADRCASYLYSGRLDLLLKNLLASPPSEGVMEIMVHPGIPEESEGLSVGNRGLERYVASADRRRELAACIAARSSLGGWRLKSFAQIARELAQA